MRALTPVTVWLAVAVWIAIPANGTPTVKPEDEQNEKPVPLDLNILLTPELMTPVFSLMREMGENMRNDIITSQENTRPEAIDKQFLLVAVLSRGDIEEVSQSKKFPPNFLEKNGDNSDLRTVEMNRLVFLMNEVKNIDKGLYGKSLHTEVAAIDMDYIKRLQDRFVGDHGGSEYPLILMYSHYIPCYGVPKLPYSCAQEIKNYVRDRHEEFGFTVAFTEMFINTNHECSRQHLREGGVPLFQYQDGEYERIEDFAPTQTAVDQDKRTLQGDLYNAFVNAIPPTRQCCIGDDANKAKIVAFFVNELTYSCTYDSLKSRRVTKGGIFQLKGCMEAFIGDAMGDDCVNCKSKGLMKKLQKTVCTILESAAEDDIFLGKPPGTNDLGIYNPTWTPYDGAWGKLYLRAPSEQAHALPAVKCANFMLSKVSLCTKQQDEPGSNTDSLIEEGALRLRPDVQLELQNPENQLAVEDVVQMRQGVQLEPGQQDTRMQDVDLHDTVQDENAPLLGRIDRPPSDQRFGQKIRRCFCCCRDDDYDD